MSEEAVLTSALDRMIAFNEAMDGGVKQKPHACRICDYRGRRVKLVEMEIELPEETIKLSRRLAKLRNMSLEKYIRHALHEYFEKPDIKELLAQEGL